MARVEVAMARVEVAMAAVAARARAGAARAMAGAMAAAAAAVAAAAAAAGEAGGDRAVVAAVDSAREEVERQPPPLIRAAEITAKIADACDHALR